MVCKEEEGRGKGRGREGDASGGRRAEGGGRRGVGNEIASRRGLKGAKTGETPVSVLRLSRFQQNSGVSVCFSSGCH